MKPQRTAKLKVCHPLLQSCPQTRETVFPKSQGNPLLMPWCFCLFAWKPSIKPGWKPKTWPADFLTTHPAVWLDSGCTPHMVPGQLPEGVILYDSVFSNNPNLFSLHTSHMYQYDKQNYL